MFPVGHMLAGVAAAPPPPPSGFGDLQIEPRLETTYTNGAHVTVAHDQSGAANDMNGSGTGGGPTFVTGAYNGQPVFRFNGTDHFLRSAASIAAMSASARWYEALIAIRGASPSGTVYLWFGRNSAASDGDSESYFNPIDKRVLSNCGTGTISSIGAPTTAVVHGMFKLDSLDLDGTTNAVETWDGETPVSQAQSLPSGLGSFLAQLGAYNVSTAANFAPIDLAFFACGHGTRTSGDKAAMLAYLRAHFFVGPELDLELDAFPFVDTSGNSLTITPVGGTPPVLDSSIFPAGKTASASFVGGSSYLSAAIPSINLATSTWTWEMDVYQPNLTTDSYWVTGLTGDEFYIVCLAGNQLYVGDSGNNPIAGVSVAFVANTWQKLKVRCSNDGTGTNAYDVYLDGVLVAHGTGFCGNHTFTSFNIGSRPGLSKYLVGNVSGMKFTLGQVL